MTTQLNTLCRICNKPLPDSEEERKESMAHLDCWFSLVKSDDKCNCKNRLPKENDKLKCSYCGGTIPDDYVHKEVKSKGVKKTK